MTKWPQDGQGETNWDRLRRRKVVQWGLAYAAAAWGLLQGVAYMRDTFGWSHQFQQVATILLLIGLPMVLVLAWYHGDRGEQRITGMEFAILTALLLIGGGVFAWRSQSDGPSGVAGRTEVAPVSQAPSRNAAHGHAVAVLPFENISPDPADAYFAGGMTEEISSQLARLNGLRVMSKTAVARALQGNRSLADIAAELGVDSVIEGSVRKAGERVRITAQLVDPDTGQQVWSKEFDRQLADVFEIERDVALAIVAALNAGLTPEERVRIAAAPTTDVHAYQLYLQAGALPGNVPEANRTAIGLLRQAIALDPNFEKAWSKLAWRYQWESWHGDESGSAKAMEYSAVALELDPASAQAYAARAAAYISMDRLTDGRAAFARALELDPKLHLALTDGGLIASAQGDSAEGLGLSARALQTAPNDPNVRWHVGYPLLDMDDDVRLTAWLDLAQAEGMRFQRLDSLRILLDVAQGRRQVALDRLNASLMLWNDQPEFRNFAADIRVFLGEYEAARPDLERLFRNAPDTEGSQLATSRSARTNLAFLLDRTGERHRASQLFDEALRFATRRVEGGSDSPFRRVEVASILAVRGDADGALEWLERAFEAGFRGHRFLDQDAMFASLRTTGRFRALLEQMAHAQANERARVNAQGIAVEVDARIAAGLRATTKESARSAGL